MSDKATPQQKAAILDVWTGKLGGPIADLPALVGEIKGVHDAPVEFKLAISFRDRPGVRGMIGLMPDDVVLNDPAPPPARPPVSRRWVESGVFVAALVALLAAAALWGSTRERPEAERPFDVVRLPPAPAPDVTLRDLDGRPARLADFRGRVVFVNFWATWCVPCREEIPAMQGLARDLADRGLVVLAVNYEESAEVVRAFARETELGLPVLLDADGAAARQYRVTALPASFFVDRQGALVGSVLGFRDWRSPAARAYVDGLLGRAG